MNDPSTLRALLILLRDPSDPMAVHEHHCFAAKARIHPSRLVVRPMAEGPLRPSEFTGYDAVFFGGSGAYSVLDDVDWIRWGLDALRRVVDARVPSWASCFGFQGLALALGGEVVHDEDRKEMGATWLRPTTAGTTDPLIGALPTQGFWAQEGHHDLVTRLPAGVTSLVTGELCPEQAFRVDGAPFWASQFHPSSRSIPPSSASATTATTTSRATPTSTRRCCVSSRPARTPPPWASCWRDSSGATSPTAAPPWRSHSHPKTQERAPMEGPPDVI